MDYSPSVLKLSKNSPEYQLQKRVLVKLSLSSVLNSARFHVQMFYNQHQVQKQHSVLSTITLGSLQGVCYIVVYHP